MIAVAAFVKEKKTKKTKVTRKVGLTYSYLKSFWKIKQIRSLIFFILTPRIGFAATDYLWLIYIMQKQELMQEDIAMASIVVIVAAILCNFCAGKYAKHKKEFSEIRQGYVLKFFASFLAVGILVLSELEIMSFYQLLIFLIIEEVLKFIAEARLLIASFSFFTRMAEDEIGATFFSTL